MLDKLFESKIPLTPRAKLLLEIAFHYALKDEQVLSCAHIKKAFNKLAESDEEVA